MKNPLAKVTSIAIAVLFTAYAQAQTNTIATAVEQVENLQSTNTVASCTKDEDATAVDAVQVQALRVVAENGDAKAQFEMGKCYESGKGVATNYVEAVAWYRKAAEQGYAKAQDKLGCCYWLGDDKEEAEKWYSRAKESYRKAAEQGDAAAQFELGKCYDHGKGVKKDVAEAVQWYRKVAERGDAKAQFELGKRYDHGEGVEKNVAEAVQWYRKAAEQGHAQAQFALGYCYRHGKGVEKNSVEAVKWFNKAAGQESDDARLALGDCYRDGEGVDKNDGEAVKWYREALVRDKTEIGFGIGVHKDGRICEDILILPPNTNDIAALRLADCYEKGIGVEKDPTEAARLFRFVANDDNRLNRWVRLVEKKEAMLRLVNLYENGVGVEKSLVASTKWRIKAWWVDHPVRIWCLSHGGVLGIIFTVAAGIIYLLLANFCKTMWLRWSVAKRRY